MEVTYSDGWEEKTVGMRQSTAMGKWQRVIAAGATQTRQERHEHSADWQGACSWPVGAGSCPLSRSQHESDATGAAASALCDPAPPKTHNSARTMTTATILENDACILYNFNEEGGPLSMAHSRTCVLGNRSTRACGCCGRRYLRYTDAISRHAAILRLSRQDVPVVHDQGTPEHAATGEPS